MRLPAPLSLPLLLIAAVAGPARADGECFEWYYAMNTYSRSADPPYGVHLHITDITRRAPSLKSCNQRRARKVKNINLHIKEAQEGLDRVRKLAGAIKDPERREEMISRKSAELWAKELWRASVGDCGCYTEEVKTRSAERKKRLKKDKAAAVKSREVVQLTAASKKALRELGELMEHGEVLRKFHQAALFLKWLAGSPAEMAADLLDFDWDTWKKGVDGMPVALKTKYREFCQFQAIKHKNDPADFKFWKTMADSF